MMNSNASKALNFPFSVSNMLFLVGLWETLTMIAVYLQTSTTVSVHQVRLSTWYSRDLR